MFAKLTLGAATAAAIAAAAYFAPVSAAPFTPQQPAAAADAGLVQQVRWRRCRYWRHECADRWGWGTGRYYRCLWRHGCGRW
jgi:hypothetical protein